MESTPQVVVPISPVTVGGPYEFADVDVPSPFTFRPKYLLVPRKVGEHFTILEFRVGGIAAHEWAPGEVPASVFSGDCTPYLIRDVPSRVPLDQPVPLKLPVCREGSTVGLRVKNHHYAPSLFTAVILGELVE